MMVRTGVVTGNSYGVAGALYALLSNFTDPRSLHWTLSGNFVIMAVLGGRLRDWLGRESSMRSGFSMPIRQTAAALE